MTDEPEIPIITTLACPECDGQNLTGRGPRFDGVLGEFMIWRCDRCDCEFRVFEFDPAAGTLAGLRAAKRGGRRRR